MMRKFDNARNEGAAKHARAVANYANLTGEAASVAPHHFVKYVQVKEAEDSMFDHSVYGVISMFVYFFIGAVILSIHWKHRSRFGDFYVDGGEKTKDMHVARLQRGGGGSQRNMRPEI